MEYYSAIKENEAMSLAVTQTDLETVLLNEVKSEKDKYHIFMVARNGNSAQLQRWGFLHED